MNETKTNSTRDKLLEVAARLFVERGFDGVSVRDITSAAGANLGAVTYHFGGKEQLYNSVFEQKLMPLREISLRVGAMDLNPEQKLRKILTELSLQIFHKDPSLKLLFAQQMKSGRNPPKRAIEMLKGRNAFIASIISEGVKSGEFQEIDVEHTVWAYFGMVHPYVCHHGMLDGRETGEPYSEQFVRKVVDNALLIFFDGIRKRKK